MAKSKTWFKNMSPQEKQEFERDLLAASPVLEKLNQIVETKINDSVRVMRSKTNFKNANWTHEVADSFGYERALIELQSLLKE